MLPAQHLVDQRLVISGTAALTAIVVGTSALRASGRLVAIARCAVACGALADVALILTSVIAPEIGYALLGLLLVTVYLAEVVQDERERKRRTASLAPRPRIDIVLGIWIVAALLSALMLAPYVLDETHRLAAAIVGLCTIAMAGIAWRIAAAPQQLDGENPERERVKTRKHRVIRVAITSGLAVAIVFVFSAFVNQLSPNVTALEWYVDDVSFYAFLGIVIWGALYALVLSRSLRPRSA